VIGFRDNVICDIQHIQLPGEAESFREFWQSARAEAVIGKNNVLFIATLWLQNGTADRSE
jgi:hypothetical protein